ncbi:MAG: hypothetical protein OXC53_09535, partial [Rhodobacteraceae bacterium]|nr:hypothetical protein [Paracoccaceae bacterium]
CAVAHWLRILPPGPLAELRRMTAEMPAPQFWRLTARHPGTIGRAGREAEWVAIIRMIAILMDKGTPDERRPIHDRKRRLGEVLCDGGDPSWGSGTGIPPRPAFSENRLAQLIAARGTQRSVHLERAVRAIASSRSPGTGVNVVDIAFTILNPRDTRILAETYYRRLDRAEQAAREIEEGKHQ